MRTNGGFATEDAWYEALKLIAHRHHEERLVRDREAWVSNWQNENPEDAFYNEYPEYRNE